MKEKIDIRNISVEELQKFCKDNNLPKFRAKQVEEWLWKKGATSFAEMTSLSKEMRDLFAMHFVIIVTIIVNITVMIICICICYYHSIYREIVYVYTHNHINIYL